MSDPFMRLDQLACHVWERLARGARDADDPFRFVALATNGADGPEVRMVGLRAADRGQARIEVHSDLRTAKVRSLERDAHASLLAWDSVSQLQVRLRLHVTLVSADPVRWEKVPKVPRLNYGTDPAPGTVVARPETVGRTADVARFVALSGRVLGMDVVSLAHEPHRRAIFQGPGPEGNWVAP